MSLNYNKKGLAESHFLCQETTCSKTAGSRDSFLCHKCYYKKSSPLGGAVSQTLRNDSAPDCALQSPPLPPLETCDRRRPDGWCLVYRGQRALQADCLFL